MGQPTLNRYLKLPQVLARLPLSKSTVLRKVAEGSFPRPVNLGERSVAWIEYEIVEWELQRVTLRDADNAGEAA